MLGSKFGSHHQLALGAIIVALVASACGGGGSAKGGSASLDPAADLTKQKLVVSNWEPYMPEELPAKFQAEFGTPVTVTKHATNEEIMAKLTAGADSGIDVAFVSGQYAQALDEQGLLEPIHPELIPNLANLYPEANELSYDKGNVFSVPYTWGTTGLCYRDRPDGERPDSWNDLLNPTPERRRQDDDADHRALAGAARPQGARLLGQHHDDDGDRQGQEQLLKAKPTLLAYDDTTFYTRLLSGEASMVEAWDGWCN